MSSQISQLTERASPNTDDVLVIADDSETSNFKVQHGNISGWSPLTVTEVSTATSSVTFTSNITSTYDAYRIEVVELIPDLNNGLPILEVSTDGGSTWATGASDYTWASRSILDTGTTGTGNSSGDARIELTDLTGVGGETNEASSMTIQFSKPASSSVHQHFRFELFGQDASGNGFRSEGVGRYASATAINGVRIQIDGSGDIGSGTFVLYGMNHA